MHEKETREVESSKELIPSLNSMNFVVKSVLFAPLSVCEFSVHFPGAWSLLLFLMTMMITMQTMVSECIKKKKKRGKIEKEDPYKEEEVIVLQE